MAERIFIAPPLWISCCCNHSLLYKSCIAVHQVDDVDEQYPKKLCFDVFGADRLAQFNIQSGEELLVSFDIDAHEYQGRWFNSVRAWNIQRVDPNAVAGAMGGMQPGAFPPVGAPVAPAQPAAPANGATAAFPPVQPAAPAAEGGSADDLPF